jgi:hypothetical protein
MRLFQSNRVARPQECDMFRVTSFAAHVGHVHSGLVITVGLRGLLAITIWNGAYRGSLIADP